MGGGFSPHVSRPHSPRALAQHARHFILPLRWSISNAHGSSLTVVTPSMAARQAIGPAATSVRIAGASHGRVSSTLLGTGAVVSNWPVAVSPGCRCQVRCQAWYGAGASESSALGATNFCCHDSPPV